MIDLTLSGYLDPRRSVRLTLPATDEQIQHAMDRMMEGVPIGEGFPYHITEVDCDLFHVDKHIRNNSELKEVNLLSYMLSNIQKDMRDLAVAVADKAADSLSSFINGIAAVRDGRYTELEQPDGSGGWIEGRYIGNFNDTPDLYRSELLDSFLEKERGEYELQQAAAPVDPEHPFAHAKVKEPSIISYFEEVSRIAAARGLTARLNDRSDAILNLMLDGRSVCKIDGYSGGAGYNPYDEVMAVLKDIEGLRLKIPFENDPEREAQRLSALREQQQAAPEESNKPQAFLYTQADSYKQLNNPMLELADRIAEKTDGLCQVGPGPYGFGVSNQHQSKIGIIIGTDPDMVQDSTILPADVEGYEVSVVGFHTDERRIVSPEEIEAAARDSSDPATQKIALALRELSGEKLWISTKDCSEAFDVMAQREMDKADQWQEQGPTMTM